MSEKQNKRKINIPVYDVEKQLDFISSVCDSVKFDAKCLITLILADWIYTFQLGTSNVGGNYKQCFYSYLESCEKVSSNLKKLKEDLLKNEK